MNSITSIDNDVQQTIDEDFQQNSPLNDLVDTDVASHIGSRTDCDERRVHTQYPSFKSMLMSQQAALLSLSPQQMELLLKFAETLRRQRIAVQKHLECAFCKNNGRPQSWYSTHVLKDWRGRVLCPVLRAYICPRCGATGDRAHTISYCPKTYNPDCWTRCNF